MARPAARRLAYVVIGLVVTVIGAALVLVGFLTGTLWIAIAGAAVMLARGGLSVIASIRRRGRNPAGGGVSASE